MAVIKTGISDAINFFNLNGLDYQKGLWEIYYDTKNLVAGELDKDNIRVGLRNKDKKNESLQAPLKYSEWLDSSGASYTSLDLLITDLSSFLKAGISISEPVDVVIQDSTSPLYVVKFSNIIAETTLTTATELDDYIISVASATGFVVGQYLTIYSIENNRVYFSDVLDINGLDITLDRPLDFTFTSGSPISVGNTNMNVDGSVTPQVFGVRNPSNEDIPLEIDISRVMFSALTSTEPQLSDFGDIAGGVTRGVQIRRVDGTYQNIINFKTNMEMKNIMFDLEIQTVAKNAQDGFTGRFTFERLGQVVRIGEGEDLQVIIQDDLTSLISFEVIAEGSEVVK